MYYATPEQRSAAEVLMIEDASGLDPARAAFERFWCAWPDASTRVARARAWRVWRRQNLDAQVDAVLGHLTANAGGVASVTPWRYLSMGQWREVHATQL